MAGDKIDRTHKAAGRSIGGTKRSMNINYLIGILCLVMWVVALIDCIQSSNPNKVLWIVLIILLPFLGSILYFLIGRQG
jgi:hypothetical protein